MEAANSGLPRYRPSTTLESLASNALAFDVAQSRKGTGTVCSRPQRGAPRTPHCAHVANAAPACGGPNHLATTLRVVTMGIVNPPLKALSMPHPRPLPEIGEGRKMRKRECGRFAPALPFSRYFWEQQCATAKSTPPLPPLRFAAGTIAREEASGSREPEAVDGGLRPPGHKHGKASLNKNTGRVEPSRARYYFRHLDCERNYSPR